MQPTLETVSIKLDDNGVALLAFNRPKVGNAMNPQLFRDMLEAMTWAKDEARVKVILQTGTGKFYSSGKDLAPTMDPGFEARMNEEMDTLSALIDLLISIEKPMIAAVNGPAIGFAVTSLAHYDLVYAVPSATFSVPFMRWGFCAEGCSSYLFPKIMGKQTANVLLLAGETFDAARMASAGLVTEILGPQDFMDKVYKKAIMMASFDPETVRTTRNLVCEGERELLVKVNHTELFTLRKAMMKDASRRPIQDFLDQREARTKAKKDKQRSSSKL